MNIQEYDILKELVDTTYTSQRELAEKTHYSLGKVNQALKELRNQGYLNEDNEVSEKTYQELEQKKPKNAVILAAGFGLRMIPINWEIPKGLVEIDGEPLIERLIKQLHEAGIYDIDIVVGFMKESYEYLTSLYDVNLVVNLEYEKKNNLYSLKMVEEKLGNTYVIPCDVWCEKNPFSQRELYSWYMVTDLVDDESDVRVNRKQELVTIDAEQSGNGMVGIAYLLDENVEKMKKRMHEFYKRKLYNNAYWEMALIENGKMDIPARIVPSKEIYEINTYEQLRELDYQSKNLTSELMCQIADILQCEVSDIQNVECMKKGMSNRSFQFVCKDKRYVMRIPGEGTDRLMDRKQEYEVYQIINSLNICDPIVWFEPEKGYKLTEYIENNRVSDQENEEDVRRCMQTLRKFHSYNLKVDHSFDLYDKINFYESCWDGKPSCYKDYLMTKEHIWDMKKYVDAQPMEWQLCHIDVAAENFLVIMDEEGNDKEVRMIDWEYAGMQDHDVDIAFWALYAAYEKEDTDQLIDMYYPEGCEKERRIKIYCYVATCGLVWSNYCEFKRQHGVDYGAYSLQQYQFAKKYYKIAKEAMEGIGYEL